MKKTLLVAMVVCGSVSLAGCQKSVCAEFKDAASALKTKADPCGFPTNQPTDAQIKSCEDNQNSACTDADRKAAQDYVDCVNKLPTCTVATAAAFTTDFTACAAPIAGISPACQALFQ